MWEELGMWKSFERRQFWHSLDSMRGIAISLVHVHAQMKSGNHLWQSRQSFNLFVNSQFGPSYASSLSELTSFIWYRFEMIKLSDWYCQSRELHTFIFSGEADDNDNENHTKKIWLQFDFNHWMMNTATTKFISARAGKQCGEVYLISCAACSSTGISFSSIWLQPCCLQLWYEFCIWSLFDLSLFCHCLLQLCGVFQLVTMNQGKSWKINFLNLRRSKERKKTETDV